MKFNESDKSERVWNELTFNLLTSAISQYRWMVTHNKELELSPSERNIIGPCWEYIITIMWNKSNKVENDQNPYWLNIILCKYIYYIYTTYILIFNLKFKLYTRIIYTFIYSMYQYMSLVKCYRLYPLNNTYVVTCYHLNRGFVDFGFLFGSFKVEQVPS